MSEVIPRPRRSDGSAFGRKKRIGKVKRDKAKEERRVQLQMWKTKAWVKPAMVNQVMPARFSKSERRLHSCLTFYVRYTAQGTLRAIRNDQGTKLWGFWYPETLRPRTKIPDVICMSMEDAENLVGPVIFKKWETYYTKSFQARRVRQRQARKKNAKKRQQKDDQNKGRRTD